MFIRLTKGTKNVNTTTNLTDHRSMIQKMKMATTNLMVKKVFQWYTRRKEGGWGKSILNLPHGIWIVLKILGFLRFLFLVSHLGCKFPEKHKEIELNTDAIKLHRTVRIKQLMLLHCISNNNSSLNRNCNSGMILRFNNAELRGKEPQL